MKMKISIDDAAMGESKKRNISCRGLGGYLRQQKGRLYVIKRCVVMLLCWRLKKTERKADNSTKQLLEYHDTKFLSFARVPVNHAASVDPPSHDQMWTRFRLDSNGMQLLSYPRADTSSSGSTKTTAV
uniref:Uncharacterized protein n=1 Tax=Salix viminalis TaxID=40686 RepID=A0A6N2LMR3_SALVM